MADYLELANSYYRLLKWIESADVEKKNTALRSLDRIKRFLNENNVEVIDLTGQPFSEGWTVKVMKMDDSVPENELVFTKMVKPIVKINSELAQEGEVYVGKLETNESKDAVSESSEIVETVSDTTDTDSLPADVNDEMKNGISKWISSVVARIRTAQITPKQWGVGICSFIALIMLILTACTLGGQGSVRNDVATLSGKVDELALADYRNQLGATSFVTYEVRNGDNTIIITQPIGETVVSTIDMNGIPVIITTNSNNSTEGE